MTVQSEVSRLSYAGDGSTVTFSVTFYFLVDADLLVVVRAADGTETTQVLGSDYTVSGAGNSNGGSITFVTAPVSGETIAIVRAPAQTQLTNYNNQDPFPADSHERGLDKLTMLVQRIEDQLGRAILFGETSGLSDIALPDPVANKYIRWNDAGTALELASSSTAVAVADLTDISADGVSLITAADYDAMLTLLGGISELSDDPTPQLADDLDLNGHGIAFPGATVTDVTGADTTVVSGTAGTDGNLAQWNSDGDLVDGPDVLDEDNMASDSATAVPTQQSVKAYVDAVPDGDVVGPASSTDGAMVLFDSTTGKLIKEGPTPNVPNILINGEFRFSQRMGSTAYTSTSLFPNNDDTYCLDRWLLLSDGNDILDVSRETTTIPANTKASVKLDVETANKKAGLLQIVENKDTVPLVGKNLSLSFQARAGGSNVTVDKLRAAIVEWTSTADTVTSDIVSAWGAEGADPTLATNWAYISTPADLTLTTSFQEFTIEAATVGSSATNIGVFIWIDNDDGTVADEVYIGAVNLVVGDKALPYRAIPFNVEFSLCARFFEKSWYLDAACGSTGTDGAYTMFIASTGSARGTLPFVAQKRIVPTMTVYDTGGNVGKARVDATNNITINSGGLVGAEKTFNFDANLATAGVKAMFHYYATAEL